MQLFVLFYFGDNNFNCLNECSAFLDKKYTKLFAIIFVFIGAHECFAFQERMIYSECVFNFIWLRESP
jgi:hypothetical protein